MEAGWRAAIALRQKPARPCDHGAVTIASMYAEFAMREAQGVSPTFERLSLAISVDEKILAPRIAITHAACPLGLIQLSRARPSAT